MITEESILYRKIDNVKEIREVVSLQEEVWSNESVTPFVHLVAASRHGGVLIGAFQKEKLVGVSYGFSGYKDQEHYLFSHMTAVHPHFRNLGIGFKLKDEQRKWAGQYGYKKMIWTFDPLEARNAHFNLNKLGAYVKTYIPSYYGELTDSLNKGLPSDRVLAEWEIHSTGMEDASADSLQKEPGMKKNYQPLLNYKEDHNIPLQVNERTINTNEGGYLVAIPEDIQHLKQVDLEAAKVWRFKLRKVLSILLSKGYVVTGIRKSSQKSVHYYVVEIDDSGVSNE